MSSRYVRAIARVGDLSTRRDPDAPARFADRDRRRAEALRASASARRYLVGTGPFGRYGLPGARAPYADR